MLFEDVVELGLGQLQDVQEPVDRRRALAVVLRFQRQSLFPAEFPVADVDRREMIRSAIAALDVLGVVALKIAK